MQSLCAPPLHFPATAPRRRRILKTVARSARAELREDNDPLIQSAIHSASLRLGETNRTGNLSHISFYVLTFSEAFRRTLNTRFTVWSKSLLWLKRFLLFKKKTKKVSNLCKAEPLFIDPYAACFLPPSTNKKPNIHKHQQQQHYCLATKFIDDKLLHTAKRIDGLKQVTLLNLLPLSHC